MKTTTILMIIVFFALHACKTEKKSEDEKVNFGIYEIVKVEEIPNSIIDKLKTINIQFEKDKLQPIVGYIRKSELINIEKLSDKNVKLIKTTFTIDKDERYLAIVAIKDNPVITNSDIHKTKNNYKNIEIHFNMSGAKKWANMTNKNKGNMLAFVIDKEIVSMPYINAEIKSGIALINELENGIVAEKLSESLNSSISQ